uniref:Uncharacterized protein n=1 Tax=Schistocephalus solidus TaxID=70667 RepID=A0A0X3P9U2_SCHSO
MSSPISSLMAELVLYKLENTTFVQQNPYFGAVKLATNLLSSGKTCHQTSITCSTAFCLIYSSRGKKNKSSSCPSLVFSSLEIITVKLRHWFLGRQRTPHNISGVIANMQWLNNETV